MNYAIKQHLVAKDVCTHSKDTNHKLNDTVLKKSDAKG